MGIKHAVNEKFFDTWSDEMAYVLGYLYADGHVVSTPINRGKYVCVTSVDKERIEAIRGFLGSEHRILEIVRGGNYKTAYQIKIGSHVLFNRLASFGVTERKSLTLRFPIIPQEYRFHFIRGYFDGDGCACIERNRKRKIRRLLTVFTSGSKPFLIELESVLMQETGISTPGLIKHASSKNAYQLRYSTRNSLRIFLYLYKPEMDPELYMKRKYAIFNEYLSARDLTFETIPQILTTKGPVVK